MRCVREAREARQSSTRSSAKGEGLKATSPAYGDSNDDALSVKDWLPGSYGRLRRSMESAVTHPTGRKIPLLWRMYMSMEVREIDTVAAAF